MAVLSFKVQADIQKVIDLRNEITRLESAMKNIKGKMPSADVSELEKRLSNAKTELTAVTTEAAKAGATFGAGLKKRILESSEVVNAFSERIVTQKAKIWELNESVKKLNKSYKESLKKGDTQNSDKLFKQLEQNKIALDDAKGALNKLNQEKAMAQIQTKRLRDEYGLFKQEAKGVASETDNIADSFEKWAKGIVGVTALKEFVGQMVRVRGEFQEMETAISTLVGEDMANKLLPQIKELAKVSPLTMTDIVGAEKMMLGFNIEANKTIEYLKALSDVSMGNSQKFNSLTLAFSQMSAAGKLMGQDLNQMINAGFNPLQIISQKTGKSIAQLKEEMSKGAVSAEMVQQAFIDATSAGGKFYNMSQNAAKTINGQISMLEDSVDSMFNELGKASEGVIVKAIQGVTGLIQNYETVGTALLSLIATYGAYRAALLASIALDKVAQMGRIAHAKSISTLQVAYGLLTKKVAVFNATLLANPFALAVAAVTALVGGAVLLGKTLDKNGNALDRINTALDEYNQKISEQEGKARSLIATIQDESKSASQKVRAYNELKRLIPDIAEKYTLEELAIKGVVDANKELAKWREEAEKQGRKATMTELRKAERELVDSINGKMLTGKKVSPEDRERLAEIQRQIKELQAMDREVADANNKVEIQNKKYWEKKKQEAEAKLEALDVSKKGSEEWNKYQKEIQQAQAKIDEYSSSKGDKKQKEDNKEDAKQAANLLKIEEYKKNVIDAATQAQFEIKQAEINAMKEGTEKTIAQINLDYDKQIAENKKRKEDFVKQLAEQKALEWENANPEKVKKGKTFDKSTITEADLTPQMKAILDFYNLLAEKEKGLKETETYKELLSNYQTYMQKRNEVKEKYEADAAAMKNADGSYKKGFSAENEAILDKQEEDALAAVDVEFAMREEQFETWANEVANMSLRQLEKLLTQAENELAEMENTIEEGEGASVSDKDLGNKRAEVKVLRDTIKKQQLSPDKRAEKDWKDLYKTLNDVADQFDEIGKQVGGTAGEIISLAGTVATGVLSMIDGIKAVSGAAAAEISAIEKASVILAIVGAAMQVITKIASMFGADYDAYNKAKEAYEGYMDVLDDIIDKQKELIETMTGDAAIEASEYALELINKQIKATRELGKERLNAGASAGSHSIGVRIKNRLGLDEWNEVIKALGSGTANWLKNSDRLEGLFSLSVEQLEKLKSEAPLFWAKLDEDVRQYLQTIIDSGEAAEDMKDTLNESLTQVSFDSLYDDFIENLMDMEMSAEDFADNLSEMFTKALLSDIVGSKYKERLKKWYADWAKAMEGGATEQELADLRQEYQGIINDAIRERDSIASATGYNSSTTEQKATAGGFETMSEDTGTELNGRFTALQMAGEEIKREAISQTITLNEIKGSLDAYLAANGGVEVKTSIDNILTFVSQSYLELQEINQNTAENVTELKKVVKQISRWDTKIMSL